MGGGMDHILDALLALKGTSPASNGKPRFYCRYSLFPLIAILLINPSAEEAES